MVQWFAFEDLISPKISYILDEKRFQRKYTIHYTPQYTSHSQCPSSIPEIEGVTRIKQSWRSKRRPLSVHRNQEHPSHTAPFWVLRGNQLFPTGIREPGQVSESLNPARRIDCIHDLDRNCLTLQWSSLFEHIRN